MSRHRDVDVCIGDLIVEEGETDRRFLSVYPAFQGSWLRAGGILGQPGVFFRRECLARVGGFGGRARWLQDCEFWLKLYEAGCRFGNLREFIAVEVNHSGSLRETREEEIAGEKAMLVHAYWREGGRGEAARRLVLSVGRIRRIGAELRLSWLAGRGSVAGPWARFIGAGKPGLSLRRYVELKLRRERLSATLRGNGELGL
jgi:hypothetical protein